MLYIMSSSLENELKLLQEKNWNEKEREMVKSLTENIKYYKKLIPSSLKKDICEALNMCNNLKIELDTYREFCKKNDIIYSEKELICIKKEVVKETIETQITINEQCISSENINENVDVTVNEIIDYVVSCSVTSFNE